jgi:xylulokinase
MSAAAPSLALDVGSSAVKAALLASDGGVLARASEAVATREAAHGVVEQSAEEWRSAAEAAIRALPAQGRAEARRLVITGAMQNLTLVDAAGVPLRPTLLYADTRARAEAEEVRERLGDAALRAATGNELDAASLLPKLLWLARHEPRSLAAAAAISLSSADALAFAFTGASACDGTSASTTGLVDLHGGGYLPEATFAVLGLDRVRRRLPTLHAGGARVGAVTAAAAARLGVAAGLALHVGPGDAGAATIGAGAGTPGVVSASLGTSGWVAGTSHRFGASERGVFTLAHPDPGSFVVVAPLRSAGANVTWVQGVTAPGESIEALIDRALARPSKPLLYLPYLHGERSPIRDPLARACFVGIDAGTNRDDLVRAVLEGVALGFAHALAALAPEGVRQLIFSGGGARSAGIAALLAAATAAEVALDADAEDAALRGALHCARVADGEVRGFAITPRVAARIAPDPAAAALLARKGAIYRSLHPALAAAFVDLAAL